MSKEKGIFEEIEEILKKEADNWKKKVKDDGKNDHYYKAFGNPFLTIFQILSIWARNNKDDFKKSGKSIGGEGEGKDALSIIITKELSDKIIKGEITNIELGVLSYLEFINVGGIFKGPDISNPDKDKDMRPTNIDAGKNITLFRYKELI